jgi:hypothetical protein
MTKATAAKKKKDSEVSFSTLEDWRNHFLPSDLLSKINALPPDGTEDVDLTQALLQKIQHR